MSQIKDKYDKHINIMEIKYESKAKWFKPKENFYKALELVEK